MPRIEIHRKSVHDAPLYDPASPQAGLYRAIVTDDPAFAAPISVIRLSEADWLSQLADALGIRSR
jgi:hypothetical protein